VLRSAPADATLGDVVVGVVIILLQRGAKSRAFFCSIRALHRCWILRITNSQGESMHDALSGAPHLLTQDRHDHVETLLSTHFARLYVQMIELAAFTLGTAMVLAIIVVMALRV